MRRTRSNSLIFLFVFRVALVLTIALSTFNLPAASPLYAQSDAVNLIPDPGFETEVDPWDACGDATGVDIQATGVTAAMVHSGRYAARIHYDTDNTTCGGTPFFDATAQVWQGFAVPADAQDLTISFWYSRIGDTLFPLRPILGVSTNDDEPDLLLDLVQTTELEGWSFYRTELNLQELEQVRGKSLNLFFSIFTLSAQSAGSDNTIPTTAAPGSYYIDDVRVTTVVERTTESPLPADLQGDTRPLVYRNANGIARLNSDGSDVQTIYTGDATLRVNPIWSSDGTHIAVLKNLATTSPDPNVIDAFFNSLNTIDANGNNFHEIYRTTGTPGRRATPTQDEIPALNVEILSLDWSPDDTLMALTICSSNTFGDGSVSDPICWVEIINVANGESIHKIEPAFRPSWSSDNRLLFEDTDAYQERADGIWEVDMNQNPPVETLLVPGTGTQSNPSLETDNWPVWSPDATKFVTVRDVAGYSYHPNGTRNFHQAITLFERDSLIAESILLLDHGTNPGGFTWSPDGKYLLYTLFQGDISDIWWLEVATGKTGKVTTGGATNVDWRPVCLGDACDVAPGMDRLHLPLIEGNQ